MRYIAVRDTGNKSKATLFRVGEDLDRWAQKDLLDRVDRMIIRKYGKGPEYLKQKSVIFIYPLRHALKYYPVLRNQLRVYDEAYVSKLEQIERNKQVKKDKNIAVTFR